MNSIILLAGSVALVIIALLWIESMMLEETKRIASLLDSIEDILFITSAKLRSLDKGINRSIGSSDSSKPLESISELNDSMGIDKNPSTRTEVK